MNIALKDATVGSILGSTLASTIGISTGLTATTGSGTTTGSSLTKSALTLSTLFPNPATFFSQSCMNNEYSNPLNLLLAFLITFSSSLIKESILHTVDCTADLVSGEREAISILISSSSIVWLFISNAEVLLSLSLISDIIERILASPSAGIVTIPKPVKVHPRLIATHFLCSFLPSISISYILLSPPVKCSHFLSISVCIVHPHIEQVELSTLASILTLSNIPVSIWRAISGLAFLSILHKPST